jgi:putative hydrolase of the HAD superfamily
MSDPFAAIFRNHFRPLEPLATGVEPVLAELRGIRAVLFDLYGTLVISGSGEVGTAAASCDEAMAGALGAVGLQAARPLDGAAELLFERIRASHERDRAAGVDYPEVQIADVWREVLAALASRGALDAAAVASVDLRRLAVEYEGRANPCWPMPGAAECLAALRAGGMLLGIVSNAQFYALSLFPSLWGGSAEQCGFDPALQFYSFQYGRAKPGTALFETAREALRARGVEPSATLYVGNDVLNDVGPASMVGFRTALFAGDARSFRRREDEPSLAGVRPDLLLTALAQLERCVMIA